MIHVLILSSNQCPFSSLFLTDLWVYFNSLNPTNLFPHRLAQPYHGFFGIFIRIKGAQADILLAAGPEPRARRADHSGFFKERKMGSRLRLTLVYCSAQGIYPVF